MKQKKRHLDCFLGCLDSLVDRLGYLLGYVDTLLGDFQHQDRPKIAFILTLATPNASAKHFKAKVAKTVRVLFKTRI